MKLTDDAEFLTDEQIEAMRREAHLLETEATELARKAQMLRRRISELDAGRAALTKGE